MIPAALLLLLSALATLCWLDEPLPGEPDPHGNAPADYERWRWMYCPARRVPRAIMRRNWRST